MFAFGLWDDGTRELWLVRDRFGVKPLFYASRPGFLVFASEIKGVLPALPPPALDEEALHHFLSLNYTPAPRTLFRGVAQLLPAHELVCRVDGTTRISRWWDVEPTSPPADAVAAGDEPPQHRQPGRFDQATAPGRSGSTPTGSAAGRDRLHPDASPGRHRCRLPPRRCRSARSEPGSTD